MHFLFGGSDFIHGLDNKGQFLDNECALGQVARHWMSDTLLHVPMMAQRTDAFVAGRHNKILFFKQNCFSYKSHYFWQNLIGLLNNTLKLWWILELLKFRSLQLEFGGGGGMFRNS